MQPPTPVPHAYTNVCRRVGELVTKVYAGPDAPMRQAREEAALRALAGRLPVARVLDSSPGMLTTAYVDGIPGQELMTDEGAAAALLSLGRLLADLQTVRPVFDPAYDGSGVLVHHDFGPNNTVQSPDGSAVRLLADWEWCTVGNRITDLAWCEFIVRLHHSDQVRALTALWDGYGERPTWALRQAAMAERAIHHGRWVRDWRGESGAAVWRQRINTLASWQELPGSMSGS